MIKPEMVIKALGGQTGLKRKAKRILFIAPHLSTGGGPQYLLRSIEQLMAVGCEVSVVEYRNISDEFTVQRNQIRGMVNVRTLNDNKAVDLALALELSDPDIVHVQEFPESFMDKDSIAAVYCPERTYGIIETTHGRDVLSSCGAKRTVPDGLVFVGKYHADKYRQASWARSINVVEYDAAARRFGKILIVGLFAPWKNQAEAFEVARRLPGIQFLFVGNQAPNFAEYWRPLMEQKPDNCLILGECSNVDEYYDQADLVLFPSTDELNPLVPKEAIAHGKPVLMRELETYCGQYDYHPLVTYIRDVDSTVAAIKECLLPMATGLMKAYSL